MNQRKIYLGAVGSGLPLIDLIKKHLGNNYNLNDLSDANKNYVEVGSAVGKAVSEDKDSIGIIACGNGFGISYGANIHDVRVSNCINQEQVISTRSGNDANILALGARFVSEADALTMVDLFLSTEFGQGLDPEVIEFLSDSFKQITKERK